jgi:hypothetical protein
MSRRLRFVPEGGSLIEVTCRTAGPSSMPPGSEERISTVSSMQPRDGDPISPPLLEGSFRRRPESTGPQLDRPDRNRSRQLESRDGRRASGGGGDPGPTSAPSSPASEEIPRALVPRDQSDRAPGALRRIRLVRRRLPASRREAESGRSQRGLPDRKLSASAPLRRGIGSRQGSLPTDSRVAQCLSSEAVYPGVRITRSFELAASQLWPIHALQPLDAAPESLKTWLQPFNPARLPER